MAWNCLKCEEKFSTGDELMAHITICHTAEILDEWFEKNCKEADGD